MKIITKEDVECIKKNMEHAQYGWPPLAGRVATSDDIAKAVKSAVDFLELHGYVVYPAFNTEYVQSSDNETPNGISDGY